MDKFVTSIKEKYKERLINREKQWPPCHSDKLIRLKLVERKKEEGSSAKQQRGREDRHKGREDKAVKQTSIAYGDLFNVESGKRPVRKVLVEGDAGIGKTTLCIAVSEDWAHGKLFQQFELVLLLPLRHKAIAAVGSIPEMLNLLHSSKKLCSTIADLLEEMEGNKVLIIADGWDELAESAQQEGSFLHRLIFGELLPFISVMLTSRPSASASFHQLSLIDRFIEVCGFDKENIVDYIQSEFASADQSKISHLLEQLESNSLVESVCSVPLNCTIVCHLWRTLEEALPTTMTELYTKIILNIILRNVQKKDEFKSVRNLPDFDLLPETLRESWYHLCKFAFQAMKKVTIVFSEKELTCFFPQGLDKILCFGLLQTAECVLATGCETSFHFLHLTFQEYLAALYLSGLPSKEQLEHFQSSIEKSSKAVRLSRMTYRFFFGIYFNILHMKSDNLNFERVIKCLSCDEADDPSSLISALGFNGLLLCHCASEARNKAITENVIQCISEYGGFEAAFKIDDLDEHPWFNDHPRTAHDCAAVLYVMTSMRECNVAVSFSNTGIRENQIRMLTDTLTCRFKKLQVTRLRLCDNKLTDGCIVDLFMRAPASFSSLSELNLGRNAIGEASIKAITRGLKQSQCAKLVRLDLSHNSLTLSSIQTLICTDSLVNLEWLDLQGTFTTDPARAGREQVANLLNALSEHCHCLKMLDLSQNEFLILSILGASALGKLMSKSCKVALLGLRSHSSIVNIYHPISDGLQLSLTAVYLGGEGLSTFIENLSGQNKLTRLELQGSGISAEGVSRLADDVCSGKIIIQGDISLEDYEEGGEVLFLSEMDDVELHMDYNRLGLEGTRKMGALLGSDHCLVKLLSLEGCKLTIDLSKDSQSGNTTDYATLCKDTAEYLYQTPTSGTLSHLYLDYNRFTKEGIQILAGYISLCPLLQILSTCSCAITSDDLCQLLGKLIQLKSSHVRIFGALFAWHLNDNEINDSCMSVLIENLQEPTLFPYYKWTLKIEIQNNPISSDMVTNLEKALEKREMIGMRFLQEWLDKTIANAFSSNDCQPSVHAPLPAPSLTPTPVATRKLVRKSLSWPNLHQRVGSGHESLPLITLQLPQEQPLTTRLLPHNQLGDSQGDYSNLVVEHHLVDLITWKDENGVERELRIYSKIAHKWRQIATRLGFELGEIESIAADYRTSYCRITIVLGRWFENAKNLPNASRYPKSWQGLINLLEDAELGEVAEELKKALSSQWNSVRDFFLS